MPLGLTIGQPPPNGVVIIGETTLVSGIATGSGGAEPVPVDRVSVQIGGGPPVTAELSFGEVRVFKAEVVVPGPPGPVVVSVTAVGGSQSVTKTVTAIATEGALTGCWESDDGMLFFLNQNGNTLWWVGLDQGPGLHGQGLNVTTVFQGAVSPVTPPNPGAAETAGPQIITPPGLGIQGAWADVPRGTRSLSGTLILDPVINPGGAVQVLNVAAQTGGFTASKLRRVVYTPPQQEDIQSLFHLVHKNLSDDETLASEGGLLDMPNLTAYKDPVVVFGSVAAGNPPSGPVMVVNRRPTDGVTYQDFICTHGGGNLDCDIDFDIILDFNRLAPNFWTEGWEPGVDPQNFLAKVNDSGGHLHLEPIMFARNASCSQPDSYNGPALLPGWQEMGGDSVLINGRPLNGALQVQPVQGHSPPPLQVTAIGGKAIRVLDTVRVTGALVLDCGHGLTFDRCQASNASAHNQEIHPVYAIDFIDATSQDNLTGVWGDNFGMTYYLSQVGNTVWWFGMGPFRNGSLAQVFQGLAANRTITGSWQDVPLATGVSGEALELAIDVTRTLLTPVSSASLGGRRWMKLYDARVPSAGGAAPGEAAG